MTKEQTKQLFEVGREAERKRLAELITLGKEGKLWRVEITFQDEDSRVGRKVYTNLTGDEVMTIRGNVFSHGILLLIEPGHWRVISPQNIMTVDVWKQDRYFDNI